ncbi:Flagellar biosynthesis protein FlgN [Marinobacter nitratireducens]|uniref:Flagellar biosynthesis protein FlgN n=1 Tax=Marinobacter nitratireducens TaxID=1137280 RepID=A0A072N6D3_9GAMM|nr:flagellar protein FlgN [Marinobacter nitratireducens]KEF32528.1 Flagellar biosynthesis protein FlgN [Marinobacter nitratireducens]TNE94617.1 MAG: flagellar protein FlgN [Gammaproteobacteria bacterium]
MAAIDDLKQLLSQDVRQLEALTDILKSEKACLASSDIQSLQALTTEKNQHLGELRERAKKKIHALVAMGYRPETGDPSRFIRSAGFTELYDVWQQADTGLKQCQELNRHNGRVLGHLQTRLNRLTDIFRGASGQQKLYGSTGHQTTVSSRNVLASA